jgi:hypothetical protein
MSKWQVHITCTRIIRQHPDWTDEQVLAEARLHALEIDLVREARREVDGEIQASEVQSERSF